MSGRSKRMTTCYFERSQYNDLRALSKHSKIPMAVLIREGVDMVLETRRAQMPHADSDAPDDDVA